MALGTIISKVLEGGANVLDKVITTDKERQQLFNELEELSVKDRESARKMYEDDSSLQKIYALVFLMSYMALIVAMLIFIFSISETAGITIPEWAVAFLSTLFGAMTAKVSTITDFLFGGAKSKSDDKR